MTTTCRECGYTRPEDTTDIGTECPLCHTPYSTEQLGGEQGRSGRRQWPLLVGVVMALLGGVSVLALVYLPSLPVGVAIWLIVGSIVLVPAGAVLLLMRRYKSTSAATAQRALVPLLVAAAGVTWWTWDDTPSQEDTMRAQAYEARDLCWASVRRDATYGSRATFTSEPRTKRLSAGLWQVSGKVELLNAMGVMLPHLFVCDVDVDAGVVRDRIVTPD